MCCQISIDILPFFLHIVVRKEAGINMTTSEIIQTLAARLKVTQREARRHLHNMFAVITDGLQKGGPVVMRGFGSLNAAPSKSPRTFDTATQEFVSQPSKIELFFRPYKSLKERVKEWRPT